MKLIWQKGLVARFSCFEDVTIPVGSSYGLSSDARIVKLDACYPSHAPHLGPVSPTDPRKGFRIYRLVARRAEQAMEKGKGVARRWAVEFADNSSYSSPSDIPDPIGFAQSSSDPVLPSDDANASRQKKDAEAAWKLQKAWEVAQAPFKNLLMMGFMMWMAGSTVHLFSIGITFSALWQPISALQGVGKVFEPYKDPRVDTLAPKLLFIALNLAAMALGVWKLNSLGLLPTHASDWVSSLPTAPEVEYSSGGLPFH
ncbi:hypothetical protein ZIOFF_017218 [Zingiber officinale]|uniref:ER membrane protein complex subunit 4 n=1 Tax=Zingiber officinale TaxID=94328 RepID=A0A8J5HBE5_ZINOF|nr:hypothetical protein ZIOFF_017218 [Zingiber officinale]